MNNITDAIVGNCARDMVAYLDTIVDTDHEQMVMRGLSRLMLETYLLGVVSGAIVTLLIQRVIGALS